MHLHAQIFKPVNYCDCWSNGYSRFRILPMGVHNVHMHKPYALCILIEPKVVLNSLTLSGRMNSSIIGLLWFRSLWEQKHFLSIMQTHFGSNYSPLQNRQHQQSKKKCDSVVRFSFWESFNVNTHTKIPQKMQTIVHTINHPHATTFTQTAKRYQNICCSDKM